MPLTDAVLRERVDAMIDFAGRISDEARAEQREAILKALCPQCFPRAAETPHAIRSQR